MNKLKNNKITYKKVWLVQWHATGNLANALLKKYSPQGEIVDILSSRKSFEHVEEYAKTLYSLSALSPSEKFPFAHYTKGEKNKEDFFTLIGVFRYYTSEWYKKLAKMDAENPSKMFSSEFRAKWKEAREKNSRYIKIGNNPYLEIREVFNFTKSKNNNRITFTWDKLTDGATRKVVYTP